VAAAAPRYDEVRLCDFCIEAQPHILDFERWLKDRDCRYFIRLVVDAQIEHRLVCSPILEGNVIYGKRECGADYVRDFKDAGVRLLSTAEGNDMLIGLPLA
jgi:hypothetical protein